LEEERPTEAERRRATNSDRLTQAAFFGIFFGFIILAIWWLFFTRLPIPKICGSRSAQHYCGSIIRDGPAANHLTPLTVRRSEP
jgi:hypothetical protein